MPHLTLHTPLGELTVFEADGAIVALDWGRAYGGGNTPPTALLREAADQLHDYFDGRRTRFDLPLNPQGTAFRRKVWHALCRIPPGETRSYLDIAREIGRRSPARGRPGQRLQPDPDHHPLPPRGRDERHRSAAIPAARVSPPSAICWPLKRAAFRVRQPPPSAAA